MSTILTWKNPKITAMALLITIAGSLVSYCVFRNISITLSEKKSLVESQLDEIRNATQPPPASSIRIIYGPNGSIDASFFVSAGLSAGAGVSGEAESTYLLRLGFLEALGNIFDLFSDISIVTAMTACVLCVAIIIKSGLREFRDRRSLRSNVRPNPSAPAWNRTR